ncbi:MAG: hypothetical protein OEU54_07080 [Gemmatimonadota bacterium]|nr:hypothetical protein [Gemmatimonadota bacterium]
MPLAPTAGFLLVALVLSAATQLRAQDASETDQAPFETTNLRGRLFEAGAVLGPASFGSKSRLASCRWNGVRFGHRFAPVSGSETIQLGFRLGIEGCITEHEEAGRVDLIHAHAGVLFGLRASGSVLFYWFSGVGELLGDSTPGPGDEVEPRFAWHGGPGVTWAFSRRFFLDASLMGIVFENYKLGTDPAEGSVFGFVPNLLFGLQI